MVVLVFYKADVVTFAFLSEEVEIQFFCDVFYLSFSKVSEGEQATFEIRLRESVEEVSLVFVLVSGFGQEESAQFGFEDCVVARSDVESIFQVGIM